MLLRHPSVDDILEALGGRHPVAQALGVSRGAPYNWRRDGIPARHWPDLMEMAKKLGVKGISFDVLRATGTKRRPMRQRRVTKPESKGVRLSDASRTTRERGNCERAA